MTSLEPLRFDFPEGVRFFLMFRVVGPEGTLFDTQSGGAFSEVTSVTVKIFDTSGASTTPDTALATLTPAVGSVFFDTLQTDGYWGGKDEKGYNLRIQVDSASDFTAVGGRSYKIQISIVTDDFGTVPLGAIGACKSVF